MKRFNKFVGFITIVCMMLSVIPTFVSAADAGTTFTSGDYTYKVNTDASTVTLTAIAATKLTGEVTVPETVSDGTNTYTVTHLGDAFKNQGAKTEEMTSLVLPDTITNFTGTATFYGCKGLTSIHLPENFIKDGSSGYGNCLYNTFRYCTKLTSVTLPASITACVGTFQNSGVNTVTITGTGAVVFYCDSSADYTAWTANTTGITIYYPENGTVPTRITGNGIGVTAIPQSSETDEPEESPYLYSVISEEDKTIKITGGKEGKVLSGAVTIPTEIDGYTVIALGDAAFGRGLFKNVTSVVIPDSVQRIEGANCFYDCKNIVQVTMPDEMEYIGIGTFTGCTSLTSIVIPEGITTLSKTFRRCTSLEIVTIPTTVTDIDAAIFATTDSGTDILPGVTIKCAIGSYADQYAKSRGIPVKYSDGSLYTYVNNDDGTITIINIADDVEIVGTIEIPEEYNGLTVTGIGNEAFKGREDIKSIVLPDTINFIGEEAFANCTNLSAFEVPEGVTNLNNTFLGCTSLSAVTIPATVTTITCETFYTDLEANNGVPIHRLVIYCWEDSAAQTYAEEHSIDFVAESVMPDAWDGTVDISWYDANETEYFISTAAQLAGVRKLVNEGTELFYGKTVTLTDDINMDSSVWKIGIGYSTSSQADERSFNGVFDGNNHRIFNFTYDSTIDADTVPDINIPAPDSHTKHGLFGEIGRYGTVKNIGLENAKVTAGSKDNKVIIYVGAIAGANKGQIKHCYINGLELNGGYWGSFCDHSYGGVCGTNAGTVTDFFIKNIDFTGIVAQLNSSRKGGIAASNSGNIKDCYVFNPIYDTGNGYYQWDENGTGTSSCPIMFYYDPISSSNSGTIRNVYSSDSFTRNGWTTGVHPYDTFAEMTDKMELAMDKLTFRTIASAEVNIEIQKVDGDLSGISPEIYLEFTQASNGASLTDETIILKQGETEINSFNIIYQDDSNYPYSCTLKLENDLVWNIEYEISVDGVKDLWNREIATEKVLFKTTNEIVCQEFALYENYGTSNERKVSSLTNVSGPVTAVIKGLKNNGANTYSSVFSVSTISDGQILNGAAKLVNLTANETKTSPVTVGNIDISAITATDIEMQAVLYKAFGNVVPLIKSVQVSR